MFAHVNCYGIENPSATKKIGIESSDWDLAFAFTNKKMLAVTHEYRVRLSRVLCVLTGKCSPRWKSFSRAS